MIHRFRKLLSIFCAVVFFSPISAREGPPNIVLIYADDLGYADVSCYGAKRIQTPNIDRLAREGLRFTDGHSTSATCTPSRYSMLTGEYAWRKRGTGVLPGNALLIIEPGRPTLATPLQKAGYKTGVVGKWHLGLGRANMDWNGEIKPGPLELGFDYSFLMPATGDRVPCVYVENHRVIGLPQDGSDPLRVSFGEPIGNEPTGRKNPELLQVHPSHGHDFTIVNGVSRIGYQSGGKAALWNDEEMADVFVQRANAFIERHKAAPFFLFFSTHDIHVPRLPHSRFAGKSGMGPRGDTILQLDWCVGELLETLERNNLTRDTIIVFTSDNGPVVDDGYKDDALEKLGDHRPAAPWRGGKYSLFEGGTRVPLIVRWPGKVGPGVSDALISQVDFPATFAALAGTKFQSDTAPDTQNMLPALLGNSPRGRTNLIEHAGGGIALRAENWKYIPKRQGPKKTRFTDIETGNDPEVQLYNLVADPGETRNLAPEHPARVKELAALLAREQSKSLRSF